MRLIENLENIIVGYMCHKMHLHHKCGLRE